MDMIETHLCNLYKSDRDIQGYRKGQIQIDRKIDIYYMYIQYTYIYEYGRHVSDPASTGPRSRQRVHLDTGFTGENYVSKGAVIGFA